MSKFLKSVINNSIHKKILLLAVLILGPFVVLSGFNPTPNKNPSQTQDLISLAKAQMGPKVKNYGQYMESNETSPSAVLLKKLVGHVPSAVPQSISQGPLSRDQRLSLSIVLELNHEAELEKFLLDLENPNSPSYHQFLTPDQFRERFSPDQAQVQAVEAFLAKEGIDVQSVDPNQTIIHATGTVAAINSAFHTVIETYVDSKGKKFFAPAYELQVPSTIPILGVFGIENLTRAHSHIKTRPNEGGSKEPMGTGPNRGFSPKDIHSAYGLSNTWDGSGQTLALFELDGYTLSDVQAYAKFFGLPSPAMKNILIDGFSGNPGGGAAEVTLDIELMMAVAPAASQILVYEGPNSGKGLIDTYNRIATDRLAKAISTSWGLSETQSSSSIIRAQENIFKQMVAQGQALFAASGDSGAYDDGSTLGVDSPSSSPNVVAVGGTRLTTQSDGSYSHESIWNGNNSPSGGAGGGGISIFFSIPHWQVGVGGTGFKGSETMRNVPDVALDADPATGYSIYFSGGWRIYGGTSCAAPLWAAFASLVNQERQIQGLSSLGFPNPSFYKIGLSSSYSVNFHDISDGTTNLFYPAVIGFDDASGWGSFRGDNLIQTLSMGSTPIPTPTISVSPSPAPTPSSSPAPNKVEIVIRPSGAVFKYNSHRLEEFWVSVTQKQSPLGSVPVRVLITGPRSLQGTLTTDSRGTAAFFVRLNKTLPVGKYQIQLTVPYQGQTFTAWDGFTIVPQPTPSPSPSSVPDLEPASKSLPPLVSD